MIITLKFLENLNFIENNFEKSELLLFLEEKISPGLFLNPAIHQPYT